MVLLLVRLRSTGCIACSAAASTAESRFDTNVYCTGYAAEEAGSLEQLASA